MKIQSSRYGQRRTVTDNGHGIYTIEGEARYTRAGMSECNTKIGYFDPEGGPFISVGDDLGFGQISEIRIEPSGKKDHFKIRVEVA
jgi:hypothetical protein